ncbi:M14 family zinc carboxypeptidase [Agaribacter flavus]|uniref:M14 family zinc carboxypeptidase n=1 Tax=Agaribacter flavus TaxID=1902781 RepID=A0ABV7FV46_9ALTE
MLRVLSSFVLLLLFAGSVGASHPNIKQKDQDYLPSGEYNPDIPTPSEVLGYTVGTWHVRHDQIVRYMEVLAERSDRVSMEVTGYTHEQRPLLLLTITNRANQDNLTSIRTKHIQRIQDGSAASESDPLIFYMGYSVHGNEPSGANAALLLAYYLAASEDQAVDTLLAESVVLLDPVMNPDGLSRFSQWANMHKGYTLVADKQHREHREHWPSGRTNHYWFDLNRDWLLLTHPESKARVAQFQAWRPHILTDFHEMGTDSTYFFQPGVPSRKNPLTPDTNVTLTTELAKFHAKALDDDKQLYFSQERFDDFYYGKGSTYPDAHGSIGILFEQASSRGHKQASINGDLDFPRTIQNQLTTSLSTFEGALANKNAILAYQQQFYRETQQRIKDDDIKGYIIRKGKDHSRFERMLSILQAHNITWMSLSKDVSIEQLNFTADNSVFVPLDQLQYRLIRSLFSERKEFPDNTFYDVSNWNIALAFNLEYAAVSNSVKRKIKTKAYHPATAQASSINTDAVALVYEWYDYKAPLLTQHLLDAGLKLRVAGEAFSSIEAGTRIDFGAGTIVIIAAANDLTKASEHIARFEKEHGSMAVKSMSSGFTLEGVDLGSPSIVPLENPSVLLVGGKGTSQYEVGEIWHYLDTRIGIAASLVDLSDLGTIDITQYSHIIFASGNYGTVSGKTKEKLSRWINQGGVMIGQRTAVPWFVKNAWLENEVLSNEAIDRAFDTKELAFKDKAALRAKKLVAGASYETEIDLSHPLFFGFSSSRLPVFKTHNFVLEKIDDPFRDLALYPESPLLGGFTAPEMQKLIEKSVAINVSPKGQGIVISFVDNIHFRGYWDGTNKLMANAIYMSGLMN